MSDAHISDGTGDDGDGGGEGPSRRIYLDAKRDGDADWVGNVGTRIPEIHEADGGIAYSLLFTRPFQAIRALVTEPSVPAIAMVIVRAPSGRLVGRAWVPAPSRGIRSLIIGRHENADLRIPSEHFSLRHLVLLVHASFIGDGRAPRYQVLDLRSQLGMRDETGHLLGAMSSEGPALLSCGAHAVFVLPAGPSVSWSERAEEAWAALPERVYVDVAPALHALRTPRASQQPAASIVTKLPSPIQIEQLLLDEPPVGALCVSSGERSRRLPISRSALERGLLLGRGTRCEGADVLARESLSRVHLLIELIHGELWAFDICSTNGTFLPPSHPSVMGSSVRSVRLDSVRALVLGDRDATLRWVPDSQP